MPFLSPNQQCQSTEGKNITFHGLAYPKLTWGLPTLSLTTNSSWLPWGGLPIAMPLISPLMPVPQQDCSREFQHLRCTTKNTVKFNNSHRKRSTCGVLTHSQSNCQPPSSCRSPLQHEHVRPSGLLCRWPNGLELTARQAP